MNKVFSAAAASLVAFSTLSSPSYAQNIELHTDRLAEDNCYLLVFPEMEMDEFFGRKEAGEELPYSYLNSEELHFAEQALPTILIDKKNGLVQVFLDTASVEAEAFTVERETRAPDTGEVDAGLLSETLVTIDLRNDEISLNRLNTGESYVHNVDRSLMRLERGIVSPEVRYDFELGGLVGDIRSDIDHEKAPNFTIVLREPYSDFDEVMAHLLIAIGERGVSATFWEGIEFWGQSPETTYNSRINCRNIDESGILPSDVRTFRPN